MRSVSLLSILALVAIGQLEATTITRFSYPASLEKYLNAKGSDEETSDFVKIVSWYGSLGPFEADEEIYTDHASLIDLFSVVKDSKYCTSSGPEIVRKVRDSMSFAAPNSIPKLRSIVDELLNSYVHMCQPIILNLITEEASSIPKDLQSHIDKLFSIAEPELRERLSYAKTAPFRVNSLLSEHRLATIAYNLIISIHDPKIEKITDPAGKSISKKLISNLYRSYIKTPCNQFIDVVAESMKKHLDAAQEFEVILDVSDRDQTTSYYNVAAKYSICQKMVFEPSVADADSIEDLLSDVVHEKTGKKVTGRVGHLLSCFR